MELHPYSKKKIVLTSKHKKLNQIKPAFDKFFDCELFELSLDTDQLGTFSGEIERTASPHDMAIKKARLGMNETGLSIGIASEGSVGPDPIFPFIYSDVEHLVLVDDLHGIVISETYRSFEITFASEKVAPGEDLASFIAKADFPNHGLIVRPNTQIKSNCIKGISNLQDLTDAITISSKLSPDELVVIESDLRAMHSPSRQANIEKVANLLALKASQLCPKCHTPGWGRVGYEKGLICSECGLENESALRQEILGCPKCQHSDLGKVIALNLEPAKCSYCNP